MNLLDPISTLMTTDLITLSPDNKLSDVSDIFMKNNIHHIPIVENKKLKGFVSKSDFLHFKHGFSNEKGSEKKRISECSVNKIMTTGIARLESTDRINAAMEVFRANIFHAIPIVDNDELVGIITTYDIINKILEDNEVHASYDN